MHQILFMGQRFFSLFELGNETRLLNILERVVESWLARVKNDLAITSKRFLDIDGTARRPP